MGYRAAFTVVCTWLATRAFRVYQRSIYDLAKRDESGRGDRQGRLGQPVSRKAPVSPRGRMTPWTVNTRPMIPKSVIRITRLCSISQFLDRPSASLAHAGRTR